MNQYILNEHSTKEERKQSLDIIVLVVSLEVFLKIYLINITVQINIINM